MTTDIAKVPEERLTDMFREASEAASAAERQEAAQEDYARLGHVLRDRSPAIVITCARGSSDHAATFAKYVIETRIGVPVASAAPSVSSLYASHLRGNGAVCIAISQAGQSPDVLATVSRLKAAGALIIAIVNDTMSPLGELADEVLGLDAGREQSVAATKSFIASLSAIARLVAEWSNDGTLRSELAQLPSLLRRTWDLDWSVLSRELANANDLYVLGRGVGFAVAQEAALKLKETSQLHAEAFSTAELFHGPLALIHEGFPVLTFCQSDETQRGVCETAAILVKRGARVFLAGGVAEASVQLPTLRSGPLIQPILQIQSFYRAADALAAARGLDPDRPPHLRKVTQTQ